MRRPLIIGLAVVGALVLGLSAALVAAVASGWGERRLGALIESAGSAPGRTLVLEGFQVRGLMTFSAEALTVSDPAGVWLRVDHPELAWRPFALVDGVIDFDHLTAQQADVLRRPQAAPGGGGSALPALPVRLGRLALPLRLAAPVAGMPVRLDVEGSAELRRSGGPIELVVAADNGANVHLTGRVSSRALDLAWQAGVPDLVAWQAVAGQPLSGSLEAGGTVRGTPSAPDLAGHLTLGAGRLGDVGWEGLAVAAGVRPVAGGWAVSAGGAMARPGEVGAPPLAPIARLSLNGGFDRLSGRLNVGLLRLETDLAWLSGRGVIDDRGRRAVLVLSGACPAVERLPGLAGGAVRGGAHFSAVASGDLTGGLMTLVGTARGRGVALKGGVAGRLVGRQPRLHLAGSWRGGRARASLLAIDGAAATVRAAGPLWPRLGLWTAGQVPDLRTLATALTGAAELSGRIVGDPADPTAWGVADGSVAASGLPAAVGRLGFDLAHLTAHPAGTLSTDMTLHGHPLLGLARLQTAPQMRIDDLDVRSNDSRLTGTLEVAAGRARGQLRADIPDLAGWRDLVGRGVSGGRVVSAVALDPARGQSARLAADATNLRAGGTAVATVRLDAELAGIDTGLQGRAQLDAEGVRSGKAELTRLQASLQGNSSALRFAFDGGGGETRLAGSGGARLAKGGGEARLDRLTLGYQGWQGQLSAPARLTWAPGAVRLFPLRLVVGGGDLAMEGSRTGDRLTGLLRMHGLPLALLNVAAPGLEAAGRIGGEASLSGTMAAPAADFAVDGQNLSLGGTQAAALGPLAARLRGRWHDSLLTATASLTGSRLSAEANGTLPLTASGQLDGHVRLAGDAAVLTAALPLGDSTLTGRMEADVTATGTPASPRLSGRASLIDGRYENASAGTLVTGLAASAEMAGDTVHVHAEGGDGGDGRVRLDGDGRLAAFDYRAAVKLTNFRLLRRDDVSAAASGDLDLTGQGTQARLAGTVAVANAEIDIGRLGGGPSGPVPLPVEEIDPPAWEAAQQAGHAAPAGGPLTMALAVDLSLDHAFVRGRGLDSEWQGKLGVGGTLTKPSLTGKLTVVRGQYDLLGKSFKLQPEGTITFLGGETIDPALNITAQASARDITATATISGTAHQPQLDFTSEPPLPKDEILARVLFDTPLAAMSAFQQLQLAQVAASGLGHGLGGGGFDPLGAIRGALGLDVLQVGSASTPSAANAQPSSKTAPTLSLGKYVGPNTFVRVDQGLQGLGQVTVEQSVGAGFSVSTNLGQEQGSGVGVQWRMDY